MLTALGNLYTAFNPLGTHRTYRKMPDCRLFITNFYIAVSKASFSSAHLGHLIYLKMTTKFKILKTLFGIRFTQYLEKQQSRRELKRILECYGWLDCCGWLECFERLRFHCWSLGLEGLDWKALILQGEIFSIVNLIMFLV